MATDPSDNSGVQIALAGMTAVATVIVNVIFAAALGGTAALVMSYQPQGVLGFFFVLSAVGVGVSQFMWVLPAIVLFRKRVWASAGIAIGAALTLLLNGLAVGAVYAMLCGGGLG